MPAKQQDKVPVACPHCGHVQPESPAAYSTVCKNCRQHFRVQEILNPAAKPKERPKDQQRVTCPRCGHAQDEPTAAFSTVCKKCKQHYRIEEATAPKDAAPERPKDVRRVRCFQCDTELDVAPTAQSTMCKRCSSFVDLSDYRIDHSVSKNFRTKGRFVVEAKGFVFNTDSMVGEAVIRGKFHGKLIAERIEVYSSAEIKGGFQAERLVIPPGEQLAWKESLRVGSADVGGELVADLIVPGTVWLKPTARLFGDVEAKNLIVENGAVFVGKAKIGAGPG